MTGESPNDSAVDLLQMAEHQREAGRKFIALALGTGDTTIYASLLQMAFECEDRATQFEEKAQAAG
jgi:hypothetical protein